MALNHKNEEVDATLISSSFTFLDNSRDSWAHKARVDHRPSTLSIDHRDNTNTQWLYSQSAQQSRALRDRLETNIKTKKSTYDVIEQKIFP